VKGEPGTGGGPGGRTVLKWALASLGLFAGAGGIVAYHHRSVVAEQREETTARAAAVEQAVDEFLSDVASAAYEVAEAARASPGDVDLERVAPEILRRHWERVSYLQFQPGGVADQIYPLEGNEALRGLDVLSDPLRRPKAQEAIRTRLPTLDGPHPLRQGTGHGLVMRVPLFRRGEDGTERFWAFAAATATLENLLRARPIADLEREGYAWSLVREDGRPVAGTQAPPRDPVLTALTLPNGTWSLAVAPSAGWGPRRADFTANAALLVITAMLSALAYRVLRQPALLEREVRRKTLALERAHREREAILAGIPDPAWMKDREGRWVAVNAALGKLAGRAPAELVGMRHRELFPQGADEVERHDREVVERGEAVSREEFVLAEDGSPRWFEVVKQPYRDEQGAVIGQVGIARDVTARRRAESALRDSEERFRQLVENTAQLFWIADAGDGALLYASPACGRVWGPAAREARSRADVAAGVHPEDRARFAAAFDDALRGGADVEYRVGADGAARWVRERTFPVPDPAGRVYRVAGIAEDVSERRRMETALLQAQKMEAVGQLAGGVAHDFNNLLCVISASAHLIRSEVGPGAAVAEDVREIAEAVERAQGLTRRLLAFSRRQVLQPRVLRLGEVIDETARMLRRLIGENIELRVASAAGLWSVRADPGQVEQVVVNLAVNARDAMPSGGRLTVETRNAVVDEAQAARHEGATAGPHVVLEVADTGCGMDAATRARIFEPFFTTKPSGKGTGLGLSTVYGVVRQSGGFVEVVTAPGRGSAFRVYLPRCEAPDAAAPERPAPEPAARPAERILLVEDEAAVRSVAVRALRRLGYVVEEAPDAAAALALVRGGLAADLLVTDVVLPGPSGPQLVERLRAEGFAAPVLFMSGYAADAVAPGALPAGAEFLEKPFTVEALAEKVRAAMRAAGRPAGSAA
jgi:PAS domain S-box-containing protein